MDPREIDPKSVGTQTSPGARRFQLPTTRLSSPHLHSPRIHDRHPQSRFCLATAHPSRYRRTNTSLIILSLCIALHLQLTLFRSVPTVPASPSVPPARAPRPLPVSLPLSVLPLVSTTSCAPTVSLSALPSNQPCAANTHSTSFPSVTFLPTTGGAPVKTMTKEWQEASNEIALEQKQNPITGIASENYKGSGHVQSA